VVAESRSFGMMAGLELRPTDAADLAARIRSAGVIVRATGEKLVMSPPLVIEREQLDRVLEVLHTELARTPVEARA
jgi:beta-alanine--pyruvate transaminase